MTPDVAHDLSRSARVFSAVVWPIVAPACGGGELVPVEAVSGTDLAWRLDALAGIDAWQTREDGAMRGIASRVQWMRPDQTPWDTFTIRFERASGSATEFAKRLYAIGHPEQGWLYPALTVQAYVGMEDERLLSWAAVHTRDLYTRAQVLMRQGIGTLPCYDARRGYGQQCTTNAAFLALAWWWLAQQDCRIVTGGPERTSS
ncbi:hypothetical protein [Paraburkholderia adhaesiva]|uniref:hypothetical protein n=1 Tax=Paraburkholderia adhaesiva TaxID=2883244 RepID=UPI001F29D64E|nr:hypothetical protein [Paraburkholderia adhaesiva]